jgi:5-methyltetrahydrofolate--homocysteine methyltransferase
MPTLLSDLSERLYHGEIDAVVRLVQQGLEEGLPPLEIINGGLIPGMEEVGCDFRDGLMFLPEVMVAARAMHAAMEILRPRLVESGAPRMGKVVLGTVKGDVHDIGKNLVAMLLQGAGFDVVDLGVDVPPERFVETVAAEQPQVVGMSALLTTTMLAMQTTIEALKQAGLRDRVKIIIGGAPTTPEFAAEIGADGHGVDASAGVELVRGWCGDK